MDSSSDRKRIFKRSYSDVVSGNTPSSSSSAVSRFAPQEELFKNYYPSNVASSSSPPSHSFASSLSKRWRLNTLSSPISFSFDAPTDARVFDFNPPVEIGLPEKEPTSRKRSRVEDDEVKIPAAKRSCPSKPRRNSHPPSYLRHLVERRRRQYGGGPEIRQFKKKDHFPTDEEKEFFFKHVELSKDLRLKRQNAVYSSLEPMRMRFVNLDQATPGDVLYIHAANLIDIFIRMMIQKAGGSLKDTQFWLQLHHEGYHEEKGFYITHKTYESVDGGVIINQISTHMQSNKNIALDESFTLAMDVFKARGNFVKGGFRGTAKKRLSGRGPRKSESIKNGLLEPAEEEEVDSEDEEDFDVEKEYQVEERHTPLARFGQFLLKDPRANNCYIIAHNGGGYDHPLLLGEIDRQGGIKAKEPKVILNGLKIISVDYRFEKQRLFFRDSALFLPMRLARMPAAFGLEGEAKGMFPYLFNHPDNYDKKLPTLPSKEYYSAKYMVPEVRAEFDKWYEESYNNGFELHEEMLKYCESDVRILTLTLIKFIKMCSELFNGWNPIVHGTTLASFSMFVMKAEYIQNGDIGYIPENGYGHDNNSMLALKYIQWLEKEEPGLRLQYMLRGGEHQIVANGHIYKVDAYNKNTREAYEIHGCLWHGCPKCQPIRDKWCKNKYTRRLNPREGVFGGRTQVFRSITEADEETHIDYYDVVSMYPYLNAGGAAYPRGNPEVITGSHLPPANMPLQYRGIVFCDCLPAKDAEIGYLPMRSNQKLMFPLCRSCAEDPNVWGRCTHYKVSERYLTGVWTTDELNKAVSRGYKVLKYHEIWNWPKTEWIEGGFFAKYIKPLLAIKYQSSGWPRPDMGEDEKKKYVAEINEKDWVHVEVAWMQNTAAMMTLSHIFLISSCDFFPPIPLRNEPHLCE
ncbi:hypothetical protein CAEBREN_06213 [Caenorhabditis brenneri]|uniref:DNA-directed DNA polymerase n=1 Tax=Caenorhabditis brenneri TaxID=135651 RepID=G0PH88_CAEBE|nr:hypothetical protein CAEBREN_06213 [Caenorhabditis brenneri]